MFKKPSQLKTAFCDDPSTCRFLDIAKAVLTTNDLHVQYGSELLTILTPTEIKEIIFGGQLNGPIRDVIEPVSADEQCNRAGKPFTPGQLCWLCGCQINKDDRKACEHIFPALRAIMFNGIITTGKISSRFDEVNVNRELLERVTYSNYDWAHENCNGSGAKGGMVLFKYDEGSQKFVVDLQKCNELQTKILILKNPKREDCYKKIRKKDPRRSTIYENMVHVIEERLAPLNEEFGFFQTYLENRPDTILYYAKYTEELIKLYASQEALTLLLTEAEKKLIEKEKQKQEKEAERLVKQLLEQQTKYEEAYQLYLRSQEYYINSSKKGFLDKEFVDGYVQTVFSQQKSYFKRPQGSRTSLNQHQQQQIIKEISDFFIKLQEERFEQPYQIGFMIEFLNLFCYVGINYYMTVAVRWVHSNLEQWKKMLINDLINFKVKCELHGKTYMDELSKIFSIYGDRWYDGDIDQAVMAHHTATDFAAVRSDSAVLPRHLQELTEYIETNKDSFDPEIQSRVAEARKHLYTIIEKYDNGDMDTGGGSRYIYKETRAKKKSCKKKRKTRRKRKSTIYLSSR
jgi:hypothetical protein